MHQPSGYLPELESLRGWAILLVVAFHYFGIMAGGSLAGREQAPVWLKVVAAGNTGVTLFFVLSGFLLSRPYWAAMRNGGSRPSFSRFYMSRVLRIVPAYYLTILVALLVTGKEKVLKALLFVPLGFEAYPFALPWWTLSTELQFYLLLPLGMTLWLHRITRPLTLLGLFVWSIAHLYFFHKEGWLSATNGWDNTLFGRGGNFLIGMLFARVQVSSTFSLLEKLRFASWMLLLGCLAGLAYMLCWASVMGLHQAQEQLPMLHNLEALLWGGVLLSLIAVSGLGKRLLVNPLLAHIGKISYSMYLVHLPIQFYLLMPLRKAAGFTIDFAHTNIWPLLILSIACIWGASVLGYYLIEQPFLRIRGIASRGVVAAPEGAPH